MTDTAKIMFPKIDASLTRNILATTANKLGIIYQILLLFLFRAQVTSYMKRNWASLWPTCSNEFHMPAPRYKILRQNSPL
jgi:hypothetical protein